MGIEARKSFFRINVFEMQKKLLYSTRRKKED